MLCVGFPVLGLLIWAWIQGISSLQSQTGFCSFIPVASRRSREEGQAHGGAGVDGVPMVLVASTLLLSCWRVALVGIAGQEAPEDDETSWHNGPRVRCFTCRRPIAA